MASMTTRAAVLHQPGTDWEITELDLDPPKEYEVLIRYKAAGLCHSDEHIRREGGSHIRFQLVDLTRGQMADLAVVTVGVLDADITVDAVSLIGKAGRVVLTSVSRADDH